MIDLQTCAKLADHAAKLVVKEIASVLEWDPKKEECQNDPERSEVVLDTIILTTAMLLAGILATFHGKEDEQRDIIEWISKSAKSLTRARKESPIDLPSNIIVPGKE